MSLSKPCPENTKIENMFHALRSTCTPTGANVVACIFFNVHTMSTLPPTLTAAAEGSHEAAALKECSLPLEQKLSMIKLCLFQCRDIKGFRWSEIKVGARTSCSLNVINKILKPFVKLTGILC